MNLSGQHLEFLRRFAAFHGLRRKLASWNTDHLSGVLQAPLRQPQFLALGRG